MHAQLVRTRAHDSAPERWPERVRALLEAPGGFRRVLGGPGTGKTTLIASIAAARIGSGVPPGRVLVLTTSRRTADSVRADITRRLTAGGATREENADELPRTVTEPMVRTVHSYAFALLRGQAEAQGKPAPRLLSGPEQDVLFRELLAGDLADDAGEWATELRPALTIPGFAEELRDLLLRAAERGLGPDDLQRLGRRANRKEWVAAGKFWRQYEEVALLQAAGGSAMGMPGPMSYDAAELVAAALLELESDDELRAREQGRIRHLLVDDAHHLDPLQYRLVRGIGAAADDFVLAGDPDQSVFAFRGADPTVLAEADPNGGETVVLTEGHRFTPAVGAATRTFATGMAGSAAHRVRPDTQPDTASDGASGPESAAARQARGAVRVRLLPTPSAEASWIADQLRRAALVDGVPWSEMAVLVRSPGSSFPVLERALRAAGVPIATPGTQVPLGHRPAVRPMLTALRVAAEPKLLDAETAAALLVSPFGGADPLALRRLRRGLRRLEQAAGGQRDSDELLLEALRGDDILAGLSTAEAAPIRRIAGLLADARAAIARGVGVEQVLWELWRASGVEDRLLRQLARGGTLAEQADIDLDAVVALFDAAGRYAERLPAASVAGFVDYLSAQHIVGDSLAPTAVRGAGVALLTAHAAVGREWTVVAVAGVQEGTWPDLRLRGSLLGVERLVDQLSGVAGDTVSATAPILAEERRLFYLAVSRARRTLLVSAVAGEDEQPSRFLDEIEPRGADERPVARPRSAQRPLILAELVGELRKVVCDLDEPADRRARAAKELGRLAHARVPGAHPDQWYGVAEPSTAEPVRPPEALLNVSPSIVDTLARCPLRWLLERHGGSDPAQLAAVTGTLVHALAQAAADGADPDTLREVLADAWDRVDAGAPWFSRRERRRVEQMVRTFLDWLRGSRIELSQVDVEHDVDVRLPDAEGEPAVRLRGRVDRLERDSHGRPVIVDIKTGKTPVSAADAEQHPQLAAYQLAAVLGAFADLGPNAAEPGGATLVYVSKAHNKTGAAERNQAPLDEEAQTRWLGLVRSAAAASIGPGYDAAENPDCDRCPARFSCPLRPEGRQVTS